MDNCQRKLSELWKNCKILQLSPTKLSVETVRAMKKFKHLTVVPTDSCPLPNCQWKLSELWKNSLQKFKHLTVVPSDSCPLWQSSPLTVVSLTENVWHLSASQETNLADLFLALVFSSILPVWKLWSSPALDALSPLGDPKTPIYKCKEATLLY